MKKIIHNIYKILNKFEYAVMFIIFTIILISIYLITSNFFVIGTTELNPNGFESVTLIMLILLAIGTGLLITGFIYNKYNKKFDKSCAISISGSSIGLFASVCPVCPPILAFLLAGNASYVLSKFGNVFSIIGLTIVYFGVYKTFEAI